MAGAEGTATGPAKLAGCSEMPIQPHPPPTGPSGGFSLCPFVASSLTAFLSFVRPGSPRLQAFAVPSAWDSHPVTPQKGPSNCSSTDDCPRGPSSVMSPFLFPSPLTILSLLPWFTTFVCQVSCYPSPTNPHSHPRNSPLCVLWVTRRRHPFRAGALRRPGEAL